MNTNRWPTKLFARRVVALILVDASLRVGGYEPGSVMDKEDLVNGSLMPTDSFLDSSLRNLKFEAHQRQVEA
jgi:hypothetical protein